VNYIRVGGVLHDFPKGWLRDCEAYLDRLEKNMGELERLVTGNEIFQARTMGVYFISDGSEYPWRVKLRGPSLVNLQVLPEVVRGYRMSDVIAILGSLDLILGEVDR
jgi:NADH:ubiquinone oxidoreductase subunit D